MVSRNPFPLLSLNINPLFRNDALICKVFNIISCPHRNNHIRCRNCNHVGHNAKDCTERARAVVCYMCGLEGHFSENCKNAKCLRCGVPIVSYSYKSCMNCRRLNNSSCFLCGGKGHVKSNCPDTWRRFHATLSGTEGIVTKPFGGPDRAHKPLNQIWCSNCGKKGHYLHHCRAYNYSSYPIPVLHIVSYDNLLPRAQTSVYEEGGLSSPSSKHQKRKDALREIKEKKRAFRSLNHTPNTYESYGETSYSTPVTPPSGESNYKLDNTSESLVRAKNTLEELLSEKDKTETSTKKWRKQQKIKQRENKNLDEIPINSYSKSQSFFNATELKEVNEDISYMGKVSKRRKKGPSNFKVKSTQYECDNSINDCDFNSSNDRKKKTKRKNNLNLDVSYGTSLRPPNLMNRLDKLYKIKNVNKEKNMSKIAQKRNMKADKMLSKLVKQTVGQTKKSTHYALSQILKNMKRKK